LRYAKKHVQMRTVGCHEIGPPCMHGKRDAALLLTRLGRFLFLCLYSRRGYGTLKRLKMGAPPKSAFK
jgi:hypothetical protein